MRTLIYLLAWGGFFFLMMRYGCGAHIMGHRHGSHGRPAPDPRREPSQPEETRRDAA